MKKCMEIDSEIKRIFWGEKLKNSLFYVIKLFYWIKKLSTDWYIVYLSNSIILIFLIKKWCWDIFHQHHLLYKLYKLVIEIIFLPLLLTMM